jgi:phenylacetyl-CoA:acceptor oxidoreductase subunit 2
MSFGPNPWPQAHWDWRAAGNFMCGGAGSGLIVFTAFAAAPGTALMWPMLGGLALVGLGLLCVWLEIGRPWRALHVMFNPRTSWMTREAFTASLLFPAGLAAAAGLAGFAWVAAALALVFVFCQGNMLRAARGIPAWREPAIVPLIVATGLAEGAGLYFLFTPPLRPGLSGPLMALGALVLLRALSWLAYRRRLGANAAPRANLALDGAGRMLLWAGTLVPLLLIGVIAAVALPAERLTLLAALAGLAAAAAGAKFKDTLITRAAWNQGFALARLPARGAP